MKKDSKLDFLKNLILRQLIKLLNLRTILIGTLIMLTEKKEQMPDLTDKININNGPIFKE